MSLPTKQSLTVTRSILDAGVGYDVSRQIVNLFPPSYRYTV